MLRAARSAPSTFVAELKRSAKTMNPTRLAIASFRFYRLAMFRNAMDLVKIYDTCLFSGTMGVGNDHSSSMALSSALYNYLQTVHALHHCIISAYLGDERTKELPAFADAEALKSFSGYKAQINGPFQGVVLTLRNKFHHRAWVPCRFYTNGAINYVPIAGISVADLKTKEEQDFLNKIRDEKWSVRDLVVSYNDMLSKALLLIDVHHVPLVPKNWHWANESAIF